MPSDDHIRGLPEELLVAHEAMENDCNVSLPFGGKAKYDLLIERGGEVLKIQVKKASPYRGQSHRQEISRLDQYTESQVDFFAGVVNVDEIDTEYELSVDAPRHIFYKAFDEVSSKTARVNYRSTEEMTDHNMDEANLPEDFDFNAKVEPQLPNRDE
jgi:hypothetical protein